MDPIIIYTDSAGTDKGALRSFQLDLAFGADEQSFELACSGPAFAGGEYVYIDGTEYGGIIDQYTQSTNNDLTVYTGRTWHGMLAGKVLVPASGSDYYTVSGDANACIAAVLSKVGLASVLTARSTAAGFSISYQFARFCNAYEGLLKMCASAGAVLMVQRHDGITEVWAEQAAAIEDEADSDLMEFDVTRAHRVVNHLVCAGEGELRDREVIDLYADGSGNISTSQTFTGIDEVALFYDYSGADSAELLSSGTQKLKEYQTSGGASVNAVGRGDWHVGNRLQVRDNRTGTVVTAVIAKKIVKVERGVLTVDYEVGDHIAAEAANFDANLSGIAELPKAINPAKFDSYYNLERGTVIPTGTDLNTLKTQGTYSRDNTNSAVATLTNCPVTSAFKLWVENIISKYYLVQRIVTYTYGEEWVRYIYSTDSGTTWTYGAWFRKPPASTTAATANRFLATPNGSAGLPSYRAIADADLPNRLTPASYNVLTLVSQTTAQAGNFTVTAATLYTSGFTAQLVVDFTNDVALTANTEYSVCSIANAICPVLRTAANVTDNVWGACIVTGGTLYIRPSNAIAISTATRHFQATYILASAYNG